MKDITIDGVKFTDKDVINVDEYIPRGDFNPHKVRPWIFHNEGFILGVAFAGNLQDAMDILADSGRINHFLITPEERGDYPGLEEGEASGVSFLGNASEPFDTESISFIEIESAPPFSLVSLLLADRS